MASRTPSLRRCWTMSTTSPSQQGVEGTASEVVWMITEESAILVMSTSLLGKFCILPLKEAHFRPIRYKLYLVAQFVGFRAHPHILWGVKNVNERASGVRSVRNVSDVSRSRGFSIRRLRCVVRFFSPH